MVENIISFALRWAENWGWRLFLRTLAVRNFRALENIEVEFAEGVNVIVGPNAIGKTTVLESVRLAKAMLAPRSQNEAQQVLISLGAIVPHNPQQFIGDSLVQSLERPLEIRCGYKLTDLEVLSIRENTSLVVTSLVQDRAGPGIGPANFAAFLSSPVGQQALRAAEAEVDEGLKRLSGAGNVCRLDLLADFKAGRVTSPDPIGATFIRFLDGTQSPDRSKFSYFPADRALPRGEQPIQLGSQDAAQQLEAHNSQPQTKYTRLKNTVFGAIIASDEGRQDLNKDFETIFSGILRGRELVGARVNQWGMLSTLVRDTDSGRIFDIDAMSSGEKGVILTFLLIARTLSNDGLVLLDEPELHLNPAVCKDLLPFVIDNYAIPKNLQLLICSHSPEILAGAFDREECSLYHLVSGTMLTRVRRTDEALIHEALRRLGTSESEGLLYKGTIFVEGEHDVELLEHGFANLLRQYKLKDLGGRREIEKQIASLQEAETRGDRLTPRYFIFDRDEAPTHLASSTNVRLLQWDRRCLENYLIELDVLADLLMDKEITHRPIGSIGELTQRLKQHAMEHLNDSVIGQVYDQYSFKHLGRRPSETNGKSFGAAGEALFDGIQAVRDQVGQLDRNEWVQEFERRCAELRAKLEPVWDTQWRELCDGKRLFKEIQQFAAPKMPLLTFKKRVMERMRTGQSTNWTAVESLLKKLIAAV